MVEPGQVLDGKYRIIRLIGEGGMGAVFEGENVRISRRVAIKVLHGAALSNAETVQRFEREAQAAGRIGSEHILEILDLGVLPDGERYMVMEYLAGDSLSARIRKLGRMTPEQIVPLVRQALVGLGAAHTAGIVHRDLKPDNIFVLNERSGIRDYVKIIDFGISKFNVLGGDMSMTRTGAVMGTPFYMSPEQAKGSGGVDARTDLYAMGVILYEAVTGEVPFTANTFNELMFKIVLSDPTPLAQVVPDINPAFAALVSKAMTREAAQRFGSAEEMIRALDELGLGARTGADATRPSPGYETRPEPRAGLASTSGASTQGSFATSQQGLPPAKSNKSALGVVAVAAVLVLGGGAFGLMKVMDGKKTDQGTGAQPAANAAVTAPTAPAAATAAPPAHPVEAAPSSAPASTPSATPAPTATAAESAAKAAPTAPAAAPVAAPVAKAAHAAPAPHHPAAAPKPKSGSNASSRDFGY